MGLQELRREPKAGLAGSGRADPAEIEVAGVSGIFRTGVLSLHSDCFTRFGNPAWPGVRTANFAAFGSWSEALLKNAESLRDSDALMRVAVPQASRPRWAAQTDTAR